MPDKPTYTQGGTQPPTRDANATQGVQRRDLNAAQRVTLALKLRAARLTYEQIAAKCGYENRGTAWRAVQRELQRNISTNVEEMRREELAMLDDLQQECYTRMKDKTHDKAMLFAVDRLLQISERRAKLMGLDMQKDERPANLVVVREVPAGLLSTVEAKTE